MDPITELLSGSATGGLILSLAGVSGIAVILTEILPFGAAKRTKIGQSVLYSCTLTFMWYAVGDVNMPAIKAAEVASHTWVRLIILGLAGAISGLLASGGVFAAKQIGTAIANLRAKGE